MKDVLNAVGTIAKAVGGAVDALVPLAVGGRTPITVVIATLAPYLRPVVCALYPPACPVVDAIGSAAAALAPLFAFASVVRPSEPAPAK